MGKLAWSELSRWLGKFRAKPINKTSSPNVKFASVSTIAYQCSNTFRRSTRTILEQVNVSGVLSLSKYFLNVKIFYQSNGPGPIISSFLCWVFLSCFFFSFIKGKKIPFNLFLSCQVLIGIIAKLVIAKVTDIPSYSKTMLTSKVTSQGQPVALL